MGNKGTIIYIGGFELPDKNAAAHRVLSNGKIFRDLDYNVVFIGIDRSLEANSNIINTKKNIQGFDTWAIPYPKSLMDWSKYLFKIEHFKAIFKLYEDISLVVAYNYQAVALNRLKSYCWNQNCKIIADCTEWYSTKGLGVVNKIIKGTDSFLRMRIIQKKLDGLIVISTYLEKYYKNHCQTITLPPLIDLTEMKWETSLDFSRDNKIKLIYAGSPGRDKDKIDYLIDILYEFRNTDNFVIEIVGLSRKQFIDDYPEYNSKINVLSEKVKFHGRVSHIESLNILKHADICMFIRENNTTTKAGFPTKFVESISCGIPVITTNTSDLIFFMKEGINGYFIDKDLTNETKRLLNNLLVNESGNINKMKSNGIKEKEIFHYEKYTNEVNLFIKKVLSS